MRRETITDEQVRAEQEAFAKKHPRHVPIGPKEAVNRLVPWAAVVTLVDGGWMAFESENDYNQWSEQR